MSTNIEETKTEDDFLKKQVQIVSRVILTGKSNWKMLVDVPQRKLDELISYNSSDEPISSERVNGNLNGGNLYGSMKEVMSDLGGNVVLFEDDIDWDNKITGYKLINTLVEELESSK